MKNPWSHLFYIYIYLCVYICQTPVSTVSHSLGNSLCSQGFDAENANNQISYKQHKTQENDTKKEKCLGNVQTKHTGGTGVKQLWGLNNPGVLKNLTSFPFWCIK